MSLMMLFYLAVFTSLLTYGLLGKQNEMLPIAQDSSSMIFSQQTDSVAIPKNIHVPQKEVSGEDKKQEFIPFEFDFSLSTLVQWFLRLPSKSF